MSGEETKGVEQLPPSENTTIQEAEKRSKNTAEMNLLEQFFHWIKQYFQNEPGPIISEDYHPLNYDEQLPTIWDKISAIAYKNAILLAPLSYTANLPNARKVNTSSELRNFKAQVKARLQSLGIEQKAVCYAGFINEASSEGMDFTFSVGVVPESKVMLSVHPDASKTQIRCKTQDLIWQTVFRQHLSCLLCCPLIQRQGYSSL